MSFDLIIFDCDGVLVDSEVISCRVHAELLTAHGYPISADEVRARFLGRSAVEASREVEAALDQIACPVCVASSGTPEKIAASLTRTSLLPRFAPHVFSATQVARGKPAPDLFLFAAAQMGVAPARCLVIEDSVPGVTAARAAGMTAFGFCGGSHCQAGDAARLTAAGAATIFDAMAGLPGLIAQHLEAKADIAPA